MSLSATPRLHIIGTSATERTVELTGTTTIGRTSDNGVVLDDTTVSRCHVMLLLEAGEVLLIDLESTNGTSVNGTPAAPEEPVRLADGDIVMVGRVLLRYEAAPRREVNGGC
jgi:pSer/pThr/pTyr-binding forkhead associated (FHA) protein